MKNRTAIGIVCIILAVVITFGVSPMINKMTEGKTQVVVLSKDIAKGARIADGDLTTVELSQNGIPDKAVKDKKDIVGKYANSELYKGDIATAVKFSDNANSSDNILSSLGKDKVAMSITISSFAGGLSGKLQNGDIVSICVTDKENKTVVPPSLKYVKVITTTTSGGVDENEVEPNEDGSFDLPTTITILVSVEQATELAGYEKNASMHVALVYRGDEKAANKYISVQDKYLKDNHGGKTDG